MNNLKTKRLYTGSPDYFFQKILLATKAAGIAIWEFCLENYKFSGDDLLFQQYGIQRESFDGSIETWMKFIHPCDKEKVGRAIEEVCKEGTEFEIEYRIIRKDKEVREIKASGIVVSFSDGMPEMIIGTSQDITVARAAEQRIREGEAKYRTLSENSMDAKLMTYPAREILAANPAACSNFQMTEEEICRAGLSGVVAMETSRPALLIEEQKVTGEITSVVYKNAAREERTSMIMHDETERKSADNELKKTTVSLQPALNMFSRIMDASPDIICALDEQGRFVTASSAVRKVWDFEPAELIGRPFIQLISERAKSTSFKIQKELIEKNAITIYEDEYVDKSGKSVNILWSLRWEETDKLFYCIGKNVTENKKLEQAFENEKQQIFDLFSTAPCCIGSFKGKDHVFEMANDLYLQIAGRKDVKGKTVREVFPEVENQGLFDLLDHVFNTGETFTANERKIRVDKKGDGQLEEVYLNFVYRAYRNKDNQIEGIFFFAIDVTEQVQSREKAEKREKELRKIIETAQEGIWIVNDNDETVFVNQKICELLEYSEHELLGKSVSFFKTKECQQQYLEAAESNREGIREVFDTQYVTKTGRVIRAMVSANSLIDENGTYEGTLRMVTDITERKLAEERLLEYQEQLLESQRIAHIGSWQINLEKATFITSCPINCSEETYSIFGLVRGTERLSYKLFCEFVHVHDREKVREWFKEAIKLKTISPIDFRIVRGGSVRWLHQEGKIITDPETGKLLKMFATVKDITVSKEQELQIRKNTEERELLVTELIRSINDLKQFSFITSHNFRAPLSNLLGLLKLIDQDTLTPNNKEIFEMFEASTNQLNNTINDLIQILIIKNNANVELIDNNIDDLLFDITKDLEAELNGVEHNISKQLEVQNIQFNKHYLHSILVNLLSNSIKFRSPARKLQLKVSTFVNTAGEIFISVSDNGTGIDLNKHGNKIFGLYQRFHMNKKGTGLGLFMTKSQITALGGTIQVESKEDVGTTFTIKFPGRKEVANKI